LNSGIADQKQILQNNLSPLPAKGACARSPGKEKLAESPSNLLNPRLSFVIIPSIRFGWNASSPGRQTTLLWARSIEVGP
jgi:hypothetical protein